MLRKPSPYVLLVLTALFWGGNWVIARGLQGAMSPMAMAFWRWFVALLLLLPFISRPLLAERAAVLRHWKIVVALAMLGVAGFNVLSYTGLRHTTATNGVLLNSVTPLLILVVPHVFLAEKVHPRQAAGLAVSLAGVLAIVARGDWGRLTALTLNPGDLWVLGAVAAWAMYTVLLRWRPAELSSEAFTGALILAGVVVLAPLYAWDYAMGARTLWRASTVAAVAYFAVFPSVLAYFFWNAAVARLGANRAGAFLHLVPLFGTVLSVMFLGERLAGYHYAGAVLIFGGIYVASRRPRPQAP